MLHTVPYKFALVAHSQALIESVWKAISVEEFSLGFPFELDVRLCDFETAVPLARDCLEHGAEVVICHGGTGNSILEAIRHSVVTIDRTDMDLINTLREASTEGREIILAAHRHEEHDIEAIEELLDVRIHNVMYPDFRMLFQVVDKLYARGVRVLVGGGVSKRYMDNLGGKGFSIVTNKHSIRRAFFLAGSLAGQKRREKVLYNDLLVVFKQLEEGVIFLNGAGEPAFVNRKARTLLGLREHSDEAAAAALFRRLHLYECQKDQQSRNDFLVDVGGTQLVVTTLPVALQQGSSGAVALFRDIASIQKTNRKIGEELYSKGFVARKGLEDIKGESRALADLKSKITRFAPSTATVLIYGETGTGKELVAHALHRNSARQNKPFVAVNFAALSAHLLESELFGHEEGAFTGARKGGKAGFFELANTGTLFLDEVGELSHEMQLRLLRVLEAHEVMRVGGSRYLPVDVRVICATHKPLLDLVREGTFRSDLYYRLSTLKLHVPPLRERLDDVPLLVRDLLAQYGKSGRAICCDIKAAIREYAWPGNIRELLAVMESYLVQLPGDISSPALFRAILKENTSPRDVRAPLSLFSPGTSLRESLQNARRAIIDEAVAFHKGNRQAAAASLGVCYSTLWRSGR